MIGDRVKALREARAWTQEHLAEAADVSPRTVQRLEAGSGFASETAMAVAAALDVDVRDLIDPGEQTNWLWPQVPLAVKLVIPAMLMLPLILYAGSLALKLAGFAMRPLPMLESPLLLIGGPLVALLLPLATMIHPGGRWTSAAVARSGTLIQPRKAPFLLAVAALSLLVMLFVFFAGHAVGQLARAAGL